MRTILPSAAPAICALMLKRYLEITLLSLGTMCVKHAKCEAIVSSARFDTLSIMCSHYTCPSGASSSLQCPFHQPLGALRTTSCVSIAVQTRKDVLASMKCRYSCTFARHCLLCAHASSL